MTVIAWDGKTLASDRQGTNYEMAFPTDKIEKIGDKLVAVIGVLPRGLAMLNWYKDGAKPDKFPEPKDKDDCASMVVFPKAGSPLSYENCQHPYKVYGPFMAWGSGRDFAMGAMEMGADAAKAVRVASKFSTSCGLGVRIYRLK